MYDVSLKHKWDTEAVRQFQEQQLEEATEKGIEIGTEKGIEKGIEIGTEKGLERKSFEVVEGLITKLGWSDEQIADVAKVSVDFVQKVRISLKQ